MRICGVCYCPLLAVVHLLLLIILQLEGVERSSSEDYLPNRAVVSVLFWFYFIWLFLTAGSVHSFAFLLLSQPIKGLDLFDDDFDAGKFYFFGVDVCHSEEGELPFEVEASAVGVAVGMLAILDYLVEDANLELLEPFKAVSDDAVDFSKASPEDAVELIFDAIFRPE